MKLFSSFKRVIRRGRSKIAPMRFFLRQWTITGDARGTIDILSTMRPSRMVAPTLSDGPKAARITVIAPHPDDELMGPGGTLLRSISRGAVVTVIYVTDGESDAAAGADRCREASLIAEELGYECRFLRLPVGEAMLLGDGAERLADQIDAQKPDALFVPFVLDDNDDHRIVNSLFLRSSQRGGLQWTGEIWAYQVYSAVPGNIFVPLGEYAQRKAEAIRKYRSQLCVRDWAIFALGLNAINARYTPRASTDTHFETFLVLPLERYLDVVQRWAHTEK